MFKAVKKEAQTLSAALDPRWNWRNLRPIENAIHATENSLPAVARDFMQNLGAATCGTPIIYGGALNDLLHGRTPKDYDGHLLTRLHPLLAMRRAERWAQTNGYEVQHYRRRVRLLWKRIIIKTDHGEYDLSCMQGPMPLLQLTTQMADEADVSPCARSATAEHAFVSQRCLDGEARDELIFRRFRLDRDRFRHLDRFHKYAIVKYPERAVRYHDKQDAELFAPLQAKRSCIAAAHKDLCALGYPPTNFEPFRPLVPALYDGLKAKALAQLT